MPPTAHHDDDDDDNERWWTRKRCRDTTPFLLPEDGQKDPPASGPLS